MSERIKSLVGSISQETLMILAVGLTVLVSMFAGWNSLAGQIEALRTAMNEGDARLRQERREDVAGLRTEMGELRNEVRAVGQRIDRLTESLIYVMADRKRSPQTLVPGSSTPEKQSSKDKNP